MPDCVSDIDTGSGQPLRGSAGMLELPGFASDSHQGPRRTSPESGDILAGPDFVSNFYPGHPGPGEPLLESGVSLVLPHFDFDDFDVL